MDGDPKGLIITTGPLGAGQKIAITGVANNWSHDGGLWYNNMDANFNYIDPPNFPMEEGGVESLNASVAAGIAMYMIKKGE